MGPNQGVVDRNDLGTLHEGVELQQASLAPTGAECSVPKLRDRLRSDCWRCAYQVSGVSMPERIFTWVEFGSPDVGVD